MLKVSPEFGSRYSMSARTKGSTTAGRKQDHASQDYPAYQWRCTLPVSTETAFCLQGRTELMQKFVFFQVRLNPSKSFPVRERGASKKRARRN